MIAHFSLPFLAMVVPDFFGKRGLYGSVIAHLNAGDKAPDIVFTRVLNAPDGAQWSGSNLMGSLTILIFYLNTSRNLQTITMWNALVDKFADKPVQFLVVSGEEKSTLLPWLAQHPIKGWVFHDPDGKTGRAYGLDKPETVFIDAGGKIIGFGGGFPPGESQINAALEGRITSARPTRTTMREFIQRGLVYLNAESARLPRPDEYKPNFPPSFALHVSPSPGEDRGNFSGDDYRVLLGYTLKEAISDIYSFNPVRISLPASLDNNKRYDFSIVLPQPEDLAEIRFRMQQGLQDYFQVSGKIEDHTVNVYLVTTEPGRQPPSLTQQGLKKRGRENHYSVGFQTASDIDDVDSAMKPQSIAAIRSIIVDGTAEHLCQTLERLLDRPVINETKLTGEFEFRVDTLPVAKNDFLERLRDHLGLVIAPGQRTIETLVFVPR